MTGVQTCALPIFVINASGNVVTGAAASSLSIGPIRTTATSAQTGILFWNSSTYEIQSITTSKTFIIDHPDDENKYLVHVCLEGPEAGVYYRGKSTITNNDSVKIELPDYLRHIGSNYTINITRIYSGKKQIESYETSEIEDNSFTVYGSNGSFFWTVFAERQKINVEPNKSDVVLKGDGPYKYIL